MGPFEMMLDETLPREVYRGLSSPEIESLDETNVAPFEECVTLAELAESLPMTGRDTKRLRDILVQMGSENGVSADADEGLTDLMNRIIFAFRKGRHTPEAWKMMGGFLTHVKKIGIEWDKSLMPIATRKAMGLKEAAPPSPSRIMTALKKTAKNSKGVVVRSVDGVELKVAENPAEVKDALSQGFKIIADFRESLFESDEWAAVAREGVILAQKNDEDVAFAALDSMGKPGMVSFLTNPSAEDKEQARQVIDNWTQHQRPNQNGKVDESFGQKITVFVDYISGHWESWYRHTDEQRDFHFSSHDRIDAIRQAVRHSGYKMQDVKIVNVSSRVESLGEGFADFTIELYDPQPEFGTWEFKVLLRGEEVLNHLDNSKEPAGIILNDVDEHAGKINVYFVVEGSNESDAKRKLEAYLKKAIGTQKSLF